MENLAPKRQILSCCYQIRGILTKLELVLPPCFFGKMSGASSYQDDAEARDFIFTGMKARDEVLKVVLLISRMGNQ